MSLFRRRGGTIPDRESRDDEIRVSLSPGSTPDLPLRCDVLDAINAPSRWTRVRRALTPWRNHGR